MQNSDDIVMQHLQHQLQGPRSQQAVFSWVASEDPCEGNTHILGPQIVATPTRYHLVHFPGVITHIPISDGLASAVQLLLAAYYAYNLTYPRPYEMMMAFLQTVCVHEVTHFVVKKKVLKLASQYTAV